VSGGMATDSNKSNTSTPKRVRLWKAYQFRKWRPEIGYVSVRQKAWRHTHVRCNHAGPRAHELDRAICGNVPLHDSGRIVAHSEIIVGQRKSPRHRNSIGIGKPCHGVRRPSTLTGRPSKTQFIKVYGAKGPTMTWAQRAKSGVDAKHFQAALAEKTKA
jgi:hypothetical protein